MVALSKRWLYDYIDDSDDDDDRDDDDDNDNGVNIYGIVMDDETMMNGYLI